MPVIKKVRCIDNSNGSIKELTIGAVYDVFEEDVSFYLLQPVGNMFQHGWLKIRFQDVEPFEVLQSSSQKHTAPPEAAPVQPPFDFNSYNGIPRK